MKQKIPKFKNEADEQNFWLNKDSTEFVEWDKAKFVDLPNLKPTTKSISLRLPESMLNELKIIAHKNDIPYQSLIKIYLSERIQKEHQRMA